MILELGGKDPLIVLGDADPEAAASFAAKNGFRNAGQVCVSTERVYVDQLHRRALRGGLGQGRARGQASAPVDRGGRDPGSLS